MCSVPGPLLGSAPCIPTQERTLHRPGRAANRPSAFFCSRGCCCSRLPSSALASSTPSDECFFPPTCPSTHLICAHLHIPNFHPQVRRLCAAERPHQREGELRIISVAACAALLLLRLLRSRASPCVCLSPQLRLLPPLSLPKHHVEPRTLHLSSHRAHTHTHLDAPCPRSPDARQHQLVDAAVPLGRGAVQQLQVGLALRPHAAVLPGAWAPVVAGTVCSLTFLLARGCLTALLAETPASLSTPEHTHTHTYQLSHYTPSHITLQLAIFQCVLVAKPGINIPVQPLSIQPSHQNVPLPTLCTITSAGHLPARAAGQAGHQRVRHPQGLRGGPLLRLFRRRRLPEQRRWGVLGLTMGLFWLRAGVCEQERGHSLVGKVGWWVSELGRLHQKLDVDSGPVLRFGCAFIRLFPPSTPPFPLLSPHPQACARPWAWATASGRSATCWCTRASWVSSCAVLFKPSIV